MVGLRILKRRRTVSLCLLGILALGIGLRLFSLNRSFSYDEVGYSTHFWSVDWASLYWNCAHNISAPLYRILLFPWAQAFGEREWVVRLPSLFFGVASLFLAYRLSLFFLRTRRHALLVVLILCISPTHIWYSRSATPYSMSLFFLLSVWVALIAIRKNATPVSYWLYGLLCLGMVFTHYFLIPLLLPLTSMAYDLKPEKRNRLLRIHLGVLTCAAAYLVMRVLSGTQATEQNFLRPFSLTRWWMLLFNWMLHGNSLWSTTPFEDIDLFLRSHPVLLVLQCAFFVLLILGVTRRRTSGDLRRSQLLCSNLLCIPVALFVIQALGPRQIYTERYLFVLLPFIWMAVIRGAATIRRDFHRHLIFGAILLTTISSYGASLLRTDQWTLGEPTPDWRSAVRYIKDLNASRSAVLVGHFNINLLFYLKRYPEIALIKRWVPNLERSAAETPSDLILIKNLYWPQEDPPLSQIVADPDWRFSEVRSCHGLELHRFIHVQ